MIARLAGTLLEKSHSHAVIECGGIGFRASISLMTSEELPPAGHHAVLHTHLLVRDDGIELVGFSSPNERDVFLLLIAIPGIGTRTALNVLSAMTLGELQQAILANNLVQLQRIPGVGRKTAERLVLELREKIGGIPVPQSAAGEHGAVLGEALSAMVVLGYNRGQAEKALRSALEHIQQENIEPTVETLLKRALRIIHQSR